MTADEIRAHGPNASGLEMKNNRDEWYWLREIAAQLADLNANLNRMTNEQGALDVVVLT